MLCRNQILYRLESYCSGSSEFVGVPLPHATPMTTIYGTPARHLYGNWERHANYKNNANSKFQGEGNSHHVYLRKFIFSLCYLVFGNISVCIRYMIWYLVFGIISYNMTLLCRWAINFNFRKRKKEM